MEFKRIGLITTILMVAIVMTLAIPGIYALDATNAKYDLNKDGVIDAKDMHLVVADAGLIDTYSDSDFDFNKDGSVDQADLGIMLKTMSDNGVNIANIGNGFDLGDFDYNQNVVLLSDNFLQSNRNINLGNGFHVNDETVALGGVCGSIAGSVCGGAVPSGFLASNTAIHLGGNDVLDPSNGLGHFTYANNLVGLDDNSFVQQAKAINVAGDNFHSVNNLVGLDDTSFVNKNSIIDSNGIDFANRDRTIAIDPSGFVSTDRFLQSYPNLFSNNVNNIMLNDNMYNQVQSSIVSTPSDFSNVNNYVNLDPNQFSQGSNSINYNAAGFTNTNNFVGVDPNGFLQQHRFITSPNF